MTDLATPLARVIAQVESSTFPGALRFENAMFDRGAFQIPILNAICSINHCSKPTGEVIYCTSWGLFQIMGFNLYGPLALKIPVQLFWWDAEQQLTAFNTFVHLNGFDPATFDFTDEALVAKFAASYNGPGNVSDYAQKMKAAFATLPAIEKE